MGFILQGMNEICWQVLGPYVFANFLGNLALGWFVQLNFCMINLDLIVKIVSEFFFFYTVNESWIITF